MGSCNFCDSGEEWGPESGMCKDCWKINIDAAAEVAARHPAEFLSIIRAKETQRFKEITFRIVK